MWGIWSGLIGFFVAVLHPCGMHMHPTASSFIPGGVRQNKRKTTEEDEAPWHPWVFDSEPCIISRFISQLWRNHIIPALGLKHLEEAKKKMSINEKRKDLCFYSAETGSIWEWICSSICEIRECGAGLFARMLHRLQFHRDGCPRHLISFHMLTKGPKPACLTTERCKPDRRLCLLQLQNGTSVRCKYRDLHCSAVPSCSLWCMKRENVTKEEL